MIAGFREKSERLCADLRNAFSPRLEAVANEAAEYIEQLTGELQRVYSGEYGAGEVGPIPLVLTRGMVAAIRREAYEAGASELRPGDKGYQHRPNPAIGVIASNDGDK